MRELPSVFRRARGRRRVVFVVLAAIVVALLVEASSVLAGASPLSVYNHANPVPRNPAPVAETSRGVIVGHAVSHYLTPPLRTITPAPFSLGGEHEASPNPLLASRHHNVPDPVVQLTLARPNMPAPTLNFDGITFPGVVCNCAPPDTNGEVGATQYVQIVNQGFQVFDKTTGSSVLGPLSIESVWPSGICRTSAFGDPVVVYDQLAGRWLLSQFAGASVPTDECIAVSSSSDATGTFHAYDFHLGTDFFDYPKLGVWPDAYYMSMNVFNSSGTAFLGPQPFAFDRAAMLAGAASPTFVTFRNSQFFNVNSDPFMPADLDGSNPPPAGAPNPFQMVGVQPTWPLYRFHADFATPANSTFTLAGTLTPAGFSVICGGGACVPQQGIADRLDTLGDRGMFRSAYRNFGGGHEALVGNLTVASSAIAGVRWFEITNATSGTPAFVQQSTYQPDTTWRWMGSVAMDHVGDMAVGFSASSAAIHPKIAYAGRLVTDPAGVLAQGEANLFSGSGSQTDTSSRWGDYSDMTVDPVDDCTFWYTQEYYSTTSSFNWRTRIGSFKFPSCSNAAPSLTFTKSADASTVSAGSQMGFSVSLANTGASPATGLALTDPLPSGNGVSWSIDAANTSAGWTLTGAPPSQALVYTPNLLSGGTSTHVHVVSATSTAGCGTYSNTSSYAIDYGGSGHATASATVACPPPPPTPPPPPPPPPPLKCHVPRVVGLKLAKAKARIRARHCRVGRVTRKFSSARKKGKVLKQRPKAGKTLARNAKVNLTVGKGLRR